MPDEHTRGDSLGWYLTGAASHDGAQTDPDAALGFHKSSTRVDEMGVSRSSPISNITIDRVNAANGTGNGTLTATGSDTVTWTPPGGSAGPEVTILNGETKVVEGSGAPEKFIVISRTSATALTGTETDTLTRKQNNLPGMDKVTAAEASAGDNEYRCVCCENENTADVSNITAWIREIGTEQISDSAQLGASGTGTIETTGSFSDWPDSGFCAVETSVGSLREIVYYTSRTDTVLTISDGTNHRGLLGTSPAAGDATDTVRSVPGIRIGLDAPTSQPSGSFVDNRGAGEGTAPGGVVFSTPYEQADGLSIGTLQAAEIYGIWIHRAVVVGHVSEAEVLQGIAYSFDAA